MHILYIWEKLYKKNMTEKYTYNDIKPIISLCMHTLQKLFLDNGESGKNNKWISTLEADFSPITEKKSALKFLLSSTIYDVLLPFCDRGCGFSNDNNNKWKVKLHGCVFCDKYNLKAIRPFTGIGPPNPSTHTNFHLISFLFVGTLSNTLIKRWAAIHSLFHYQSFHLSSLWFFVYCYSINCCIIIFCFRLFSLFIFLDFVMVLLHFETTTFSSHIGTGSSTFCIIIQKQTPWKWSSVRCATRMCM